MPKRRLRGGTRLRYRAGQLSQGQRRRDVPHQAGGAPQVQTKTLVEAEGLVGGRGGREQEQEELQDQQSSCREQQRGPEFRCGRRHRGRLDA